MTPKDKANDIAAEILIKLRTYKIITLTNADDEQIAIDLALIQVENLIKILDKHLPAEYFKVMNYYEDVKNEIKNL
jgi:GTP cyclohydrolase II